MSKIGRIFGSSYVNIEDEEFARKQRARRKRSRLKDKAADLISKIDELDEEEDLYDDEPEDTSSSTPVASQSASDADADTTGTNATTTDTATTDTADTADADAFIKSFEEAASDEVKPMLQPAQTDAPLTEVDPPAPESDQPAIEPADGEASDDVIKAHAREIVSKETQPIIQEEQTMINASRNFYNEDLGDAAYRFDGGLDKEPSPVLRDYVKSVIARDPVLIDEIIEDYLPDIIAKNPKMIPAIMQMIRDAEDRNIPIKALYINAKDPECTDEYETWETATASISKEIQNYGVKPEEVFKTIWREILEDGSLGEQLGQTEVVDYIENRYHGDKEKIKNLLRVKYAEDKPKKASKPSGNKSAANTSKGGTAKNGGAA